MEPVEFDSTGYYAYDCVGCAPGTQAYLYKIGGFDDGRRARLYDSFMRLASVGNSFNDPKLVALRNPELAKGGGDVMWMGAAILNKPSETYNFGAWAANKFGADLPYAPTITPDENTRPGGKFFYYGTNGAFILQGGISLFRGTRNFFGTGGAAVESGASLSTNGANLSKHLGQIERYGQAGFKEMQNGSFRYYGNIKPATNAGEMHGARFVREWNPSTSSSRSWYETLDQAGRIRQVHPKYNNLPHYTFNSTGKFTGSW